MSLTWDRMELPLTIVTIECMKLCLSRGTGWSYLNYCYNRVYDIMSLTWHRKEFPLTIVTLSGG